MAYPLGFVERAKRALKANEAQARADWDQAQTEHDYDKKVTAIESSTANAPPAGAKYDYRAIQKDVVWWRDVLGMKSPEIERRVTEKHGPSGRWFWKCFVPWSTKSDT
jgi:hypothetical protein